ncbi:NADH-ubiquinone oxidoreductase chain 6 [Phtheirospermum japonicum]|uniref:NADH-ubiquinone oxidoreductase chain 6 n=1 Tax=Phtheirospermum japonicum TaxID=374723 RepID=A0A830CVQ9_9LAMI|nr:NADH-ubiquinone oxidoreductase chain 6 [Phtheirospermum japonicum]
MILSVLSSPALISGLKVVRAKNLVLLRFVSHPSLSQYFLFTSFLRSRLFFYDLLSSGSNGFPLKG